MDNSLLLTVIIQTIILVFSIVLVYYFYSLYKISRSKNHLEASFDSIEEPLVALNKDYIILRANRTYSTLTGYDFTDLIGQHCYKVLKGRNSPCEDCKLKDTLNSGNKNKIEYTSIDNDESDRILSITFYALLGTDKLSAIEHIRDITKLENMKRKLEHRNSSLSDTNTNLILVQKEMDNELSLARQVQQNLLPQFTPPFSALTINHIYHPINSVGGDVYDFIQINEDTLGIFIGDVSGHGLSAAFVGTISKMSLYQHSKTSRSTVNMLEMINNDLMSNVKTVHYLTCFWALFNKRDNGINYSRAGHPMPIVQTQEGDIFTLNSRGTFLGILDDAFIEEKKFYFKKGDRCFLFTDGIYEVTEENEPDTELVGYSGFVDLIKKSSNMNIDGVIPFIRGQLKSFKYEDDYTLVAFEVNSDPLEPILHGFEVHQDISINVISTRLQYDAAKDKLLCIINNLTDDKDIAETTSQHLSQLYTLLGVNSKDRESWQLAYHYTGKVLIVTMSSSDVNTFTGNTVFTTNKESSAASFEIEIDGKNNE